MKGPAHRKICYGINLEGKCNNSTCSLFNRIFIQPMENIPLFDFISERDSLKCPECATATVVDFVGVSRCVYTFTGIRFSENGAKLQKLGRQELVYVGDNYLQLMCQERELNVKSFKLLIDRENWDQKKDGSEVTICGVCVEPILDNSIAKTCGHKYHKKCWDSLNINVKECPLCLF